MKAEAQVCHSLCMKNVPPRSYSSRSEINSGPTQSKDVSLLNGMGVCLGSKERDTEA